MKLPIKNIDKTSIVVFPNPGFDDKIYNLHIIPQFANANYIITNLNKKLLAIRLSKIENYINIET